MRVFEGQAAVSLYSMSYIVAVAVRFFSTLSINRKMQSILYLVVLYNKNFHALQDATI